MSKVNQRRLGIRYGRMLAGIDAGIDAISKHAGQATDLLNPDDRERLNNALEQLRGISQRAWSKV